MRRPNVPKRRMTAATGAATTSFTSQYLDQTIGTGVGSQAWGHVWVNPPAHSTVLDPGAAVSLQYQEYLVANAEFTYTPAVGTTTAGTLWVCYVDNPEILFKLVSGAYTATDYLTIAQTTANHKTVQVWESVTLRASPTPRRKMFSVDKTPPASSEGADRVIQGAFIFATSSAPVSTTLGFASQRYTAALKGLQSNLATGI